MIRVVFFIIAVETAALGGGFPEFRVTLAEGSQFEPAVAGNLVVWQKYPDASGEMDIYGRYVPSGEVFAIVVQDGIQNTPAVDGQWVVWSDKRTGGFDIYGYDLMAGGEFPICTHEAKQFYPAVSGNTVVWEDDRDSPPDVPPDYTNLDIYAMDLRTREEFAVCTAKWDQAHPAISGNIIVWEDRRRQFPGWDPTRAEIYGYDLATGREFLIATSEDGIDQVSPAISGDIVVWADMHNWGDIWGYDLATETRFPVCTDAAYQGQPAVDGNLVVWTDLRNGNEDIYGYDLATGQEFAICTDPARQSFPRISGNLVVWQDSRNGDSDIYGAYIPEPVSVGLLGLACPAVLLRPRRRRRGQAGPL